MSADVCAFEQLADGAATRFVVDGTAVALVRIGTDVYAVDDTCSHANVSLSDGGEVWCDDLELECPRHASAFNLITGEPSALPATRPIVVHHAAVIDGRVHVTLEEAC